MALTRGFVLMWKEKMNEQDPIPNNAWTIIAAKSLAQEKGVGAPFFPCALWDLIPEEVREYIWNNQESTRLIRPPPPRGGPPTRGTPPNCRDLSTHPPPAQQRVNVHDLTSGNHETDRDEFFDAVDTNPDAPPASATVPKNNSFGYHTRTVVPPSASGQYAPDYSSNI